jgi:hypothetical protein
MSRSMITWNKNTIKLIYEVHYITPMVILNLFGIRTNVRNRTFKGSDPNDNNDELCSNGNTPSTIEDNSNSMISRVAYALEHETIGERL